MPLSGFGMCGYLLCFTAVVLATQNITVEILEHDSVILTHVYSPVTSETWTVAWNEGAQGTIIGYTTCTYADNTDQCHFNTGTLECDCNRTCISLKVKNNVSRNDHGHKYSSSDLRSNFFEYTLYVTVPVETVNITNVPKPTVVITENTETKLECISSPSRPNATIKWVHNSTPLDAWSFEGTMIGNLVAIKSILLLSPGRNMNGDNITCSGNNPGNLDGNKYDWVTLNVTYPPAGLPVIEHIKENAPFLVIENKNSSLNCVNNVSNPQAQLDWECEGADFIHVSVVNFTAKRIQLRASRKNNLFCSCISTYSADVINKTEVKINVLYPSTITSIFAHGTNISQIHVAVIENDTIHVSCAAEGNPAPVYEWNENGNVSNGQNITIAQVKRSITNANFTCIASNVMNDTRENVIQGKDSKGFTVDVLYPPSIKDLLNISLIEGNSTSIDCNIIPGNPSTPIYIRWDDKPENGSVLNINSVRRTENRWHSCKVNNTMSTIFRETNYGIDEQSIFLHVLYPPEKINITSTSAPNHEVSDTIRLIENTSIKLFCSAKGNPLPSSYSWSGLNTSDTLEVSIYGSKHEEGNITCSAKNIMIELPIKKTYTGIESKTILVDVLHPPEIENIQEKKVIEGQDFKIYCLKTSGKTTFLSVKWKKDNNETSVRPDSSLIIRNVSRNQNGRYDCFIQYKMEPTYGNNISVNSNNSFVLDVMYPPELLNISLKVDSEELVNITRSVSVIENASLVLNCSSLGNPLPSNYTWTWHQTTVPSATLTLNVTRNSRGILTCTAKNKMDLSNGTSVIGQTSQTFEIDVQYPPELNEEHYTTIPEGKDITLTCIRDYGRTVHSAVRWISSNGTTIQGFDNLTLVNVTKSSSGNYTCETSYTMAPSYREPITAFMAKTVYLEVTYATNDKQNSPPGGGNAGQVAGGVIGGLLGIGAVVAAVFLVRRRGYFRKSRNDDGGHHEYQNVGFTGELKQSKRLPALPPDEDSEDVHGDHRTLAQQQQQQQQDYDADEHPYLNTMELIDIMKKVSVSDLFAYVTNKSYQEFSEEFGKFPSGLMVSIPCTFASKPDNAPFNRYQGIYPYDHSRVIISGQPDFFINASYIDGHSGKQHIYIASLGPTVKHTHSFKSFWNMVWHHGSDVIVMLTNLQEPSGMKCEKYWADRGTTRNIGDFTIQSGSEVVAAEYKVRTFKVFKDDESRTITQLHYTAWPDKKVPEDVTSLIEFRQRVKAAPTRSNGPLIVHCSAGVGRTGTYIALDRLIKEGKSKNAINVFDCVMNMRKQRVNMVQTLDQYVYLHQALVYCLVFDIEPVSSNGIDEYVKKTSNNVYSKLFQQLQQTVEDETIEEKEARARNGDMLEKNRTTADIPSDVHRIRLFLDKQMGESDYINAVYLNGFKRQEHFIIAQSPLPTTLDDFVCLIYQATCCCIVSLDDYQETGASNVTYLPPDNQPMKYGTFTISCSNIDVKSGYAVRKLKLGFTGQFGKGERIVYHFQFTGWKHDDRTPKDPKLFVDFIKEVDKYATELEDEHSHVLVHCMSGSERSGLFCAVNNLMDKMEQERQVSVVNMLRRVRARRRTAIPNMEQLKFCYQALNAFVKSYKI